MQRCRMHGCMMQRNMIVATCHGSDWLIESANSRRSRMRPPHAGDREHRPAQAEQVRSIAVQRVGERLGVVPYVIMLDIDEALRLHLGL